MRAVPLARILPHERVQELLDRRLPERAPAGGTEQLMPVAAEGRQRYELGAPAGTNEGIEHLARQIGREERIVGGIEPERGNAGGRAVAPCGNDQTLRCAVADLRVMAAASAGEIDHRQYTGRVLARGRERTPAARRHADQENTIAANVAAVTEEVRRSNVLRRGQAGPVVVGSAARSCGLQPWTASLSVAATQRQRDHVSA